MADSLTTRQVAELLQQPEWRIRRVVDSLEAVQRFGGKRVIPPALIPDIVDALRARGWLQHEEPAR